MIEEDKRRWHIGKEIPISVLGFLLIQTILLVIWLTGVARDASDARTEMIALRAEVRNLVAPLAVNATRVEIISAQLVRLEAQVESIRQEQGRNRRDPEQGRRSK